MIEIYIYGLINSVLVLLLLGYKRVFEVKAKFSLDALPGHQMVLDSDKQLDTKMKNEKEKLLYNNVDKLGFWKGLSHIIYNYIFIETIAVFILLIFSKRFLNEQKTAILLVISISTVIHISVCSFLSVKLISYNKFFNKTKR